MPTASATEPLSEQALLSYASEYSFRGRMDQLTFTGPVLERGSGSVVVDINGKEYLDFNSGQMCAALGHNNAHIVDAIKESCETLIHSSSSILNTKEIQLARRLGELVPRPLKKSVFLGSGSDSNETAVTIAKNTPAATKSPRPMSISPACRMARVRSPMLAGMLAMVRGHLGLSLSSHPTATAARWD